MLCNPDIVLTAQHWDVLSGRRRPTTCSPCRSLDEQRQPTSVTSRYPTAVSHLASGYRLGRFAPRGGWLRTTSARGPRQLGTRPRGVAALTGGHVAALRTLGVGRRALRRRRAPARGRGLRRALLPLLRGRRSLPALRAPLPDRARSRRRHAPGRAPRRRQRHRARRARATVERIRRRVGGDVRARPGGMVVAGVRGAAPRRDGDVASGSASRTRRDTRRDRVARARRRDGRSAPRRVVAAHVRGRGRVASTRSVSIPGACPTSTASAPSSPRTRSRSAWHGRAPGSTPASASSIPTWRSSCRRAPSIRGPPRADGGSCSTSSTA